MQAGKIVNPLGEVMDMFGFLGDSLDILNEGTTAKPIVNEPLDEVIDTFGQLGDSLKFLNDVTEDIEVNPLDDIMETFDQLEEHLNILSESKGATIDSFDPVFVFTSFSEDTTEIIKEGASIATEGSVDKDGSSNPFVQVMHMFGKAWKYLINVSEDDESSDQPKLPSLYLNDDDVHLLLILISALLLLLVLSFFLFSYCKRKMFEREQWREIEQDDRESDCSGSWISINSSTQISPSMTPIKEKDLLEEMEEQYYWFRPNMSPSIIV